MENHDQDTGTAVPVEGKHMNSKQSRVLRGGSWYYRQVNARCSYRYWSFPDLCYDLIGVRVSRHSIAHAKTEGHVDES